MQRFLCYKDKRPNYLQQNKLEGGGTSLEVNRSVLIQENRQINIQLEQSGNRAMAQKGLTAIQAHILLYILDHSDRGISLTDIHREFGYSMASLSGIIKRLKEKGFVRTEHWDGDERRKLIVATSSALELQQRLDRSSAQVRQRLWRCFTPQELHDLDCLQRKLLSSLCTLTHQAKEEPTP